MTAALKARSMAGKVAVEAESVVVATVEAELAVGVTA